jgi:hypothetical protein
VSMLKTFGYIWCFRIPRGATNLGLSICHGCWWFRWLWCYFWMPMRTLAWQHSEP